jgi:hypothetical protein
MDEKEENKKERGKKVLTSEEMEKAAEAKRVKAF